MSALVLTSALSKLSAWYCKLTLVAAFALVTDMLISLRVASPGLPTKLSLALATSVIGYTASPSLPCVVFLDTLPFDIVSAWKSIGSPLAPS